MEPHPKPPPPTLPKIPIGIEQGTGAPEAAQWVMLAIIAFLLLALLAFFFRMRHLSRHPNRTLEDLDAMSRVHHDE